MLRPTKTLEKIPISSRNIKEKFEKSLNLTRYNKVKIEKGIFPLTFITGES